LSSYRIILLWLRIPLFLKRGRLLKNLLLIQILKPPRPSKGKTGMKSKIPRRELTQISRLPLLILKAKMEEEKENTKRT
jgi:hypothetical protein